MRDVVTRIFELNGWPLELRPKLVTDKLKFRNVDEITGALRDMAQAGAVLHEDDPVIKETRDLLGLSAPITVIGPEDMALLSNSMGGNPPDTSQGDDDSLAARLARSNDPNDSGENDNSGGAGGGGKNNKPKKKEEE